MRERLSEERRRIIFNRTRGKCHVCHKRLCFGNYGQRGARGSWHVDHSIPVRSQGTNHGNNLCAACIACNIEKAIVTSRTARGWNGRRRAPLSAERYRDQKAKNTVGGGVVGAGVGALLGGPPGAVVGGLVGALFGHEIDPDE